MPSKVKVIPCSGIGKVHGLLARETALRIVDHLCPAETEIHCLAYIVTGDDTIKWEMQGAKCLTIDGCPKMCAAKSVAAAGGDVREDFRIVDALKEHRGAQPGTATSLSEDGWKIVDETAEKLSARIKEILAEV